MMHDVIHNRKVRFALVGCGHIARHHFSALEALSDDAELVAVCDVNEETLRKAQERSGAKGYGDLTGLLDGENVDIAVLATPSGVRAAQAAEIAGAGVHVMMEKPMATRWRDGLEMLRVCDDAGVRLFVVKQFRYTPSVQLLHKALHEGRFGRIHMVNINMFWTRPQDYYDSALWRGTWEFDGGALMNQASHFVDLMHWLFGPVQSVHAHAATLARHIEAEDSISMSVQWRHGGIGSLNATVLTYPKNLETSMTVIGEKGTAKLAGPAMNEVRHWEFADVVGDPAEEARQATVDVAELAGYGHRKYYENVVQVLRGEAHPHTDGREALKSLELMIAAYRSARDGERVGLPLEL